MTRREAEGLLSWAGERNPGPWTAHSEVVARAATSIAAACDLDAERAFVAGLLHDIGRYEGVRGLHHIYAGYRLLTDRGCPQAARICLTHSFPFQHLGAYGGGLYDCTPEELREIETFLNDAVYDEYDHLIQLCDALAMAQGVCLLEKRLLDVARRYGFDEYTLRKWDALFALKAHFDEKIGGNVYDLFRDEIRAVTFG